MIPVVNRGPSVILKGYVHVLIFYMLQCFRCSEIMYSVLSVRWNIGLVRVNKQATGITEVT
jgi:hypothetical protein